MRLFPSDPRTKVRPTADGRFAFTPISRALRTAEVIAWSAFMLAIVVAFAWWVGSYMWEAIHDDRLPRDGRRWFAWGIILLMIGAVVWTIYLMISPFKELSHPRAKAILPVKTLRRHETIPVEWCFEGSNVSRIRSVNVYIACTERTHERGEWDGGRDYDGDGIGDSIGGFKYNITGRVRYREEVDKKQFDDPSSEVAGRGFFTIKRSAPLSDPKPWWRNTGVYTDWELIVAGTLDDGTHIGHAMSVTVEDGPHRPELQARPDAKKQAKQPKKTKRQPSLSRRMGYPMPRSRSPRA